MENASKALIIAGAILLSILIIALGIYVFNMAKGATNTDQLDSVEKQTFNSSFTQYEGNTLGASVSELINAVISNTTKNSEADDRLPDIIYLETRTGSTAVKSKVGTDGTINYSSKEALTGSGKKMSPEGVAKELGMDEGVDGNGSFCIDIRSATNCGDDSNTISNMGKLRKQISAKHYYQVQCRVDDTLGLVDFILIKY